jgi:hypothetical protein
MGTAGRAGCPYEPEYNAALTGQPFFNGAIVRIKYVSDTLIFSNKNKTKHGYLHS